MLADCPTFVQVALHGGLYTRGALQQGMREGGDRSAYTCYKVVASAGGPPACLSVHDERGMP